MFNKLLVPLDRSSIGEQALSRAAELARASHATIDIVLVHSPAQYAADIGDITGLEATLLETEEKYVAEMASELARNAGVTATHAVMRDGVVSGIAARAHDVGADLIVMTSHGRTGLSRAWLGSVADAVIRRSAIPVLMLRPTTELASRANAPAPFRKILVPLDGSPEALTVCDAAMALARCNGARMELLQIVLPVPLVTTDAIALGYPSVVPDAVATAGLVDEARRQLADVARTIVERDRLEVDHHVLVASNVAQAVLDFASGSSADVIAMSTHSRGPSRLLIGSIADKIIRGSHLPVLLLHPVGDAH